MFFCVFKNCFQEQFKKPGAIPTLIFFILCSNTIVVKIRIARENNILKAILIRNKILYFIFDQQWDKVFIKNVPIFYFLLLIFF